MNTQPEMLVDTDTLSFYIRKSPKVVSAAQDYLRKHRNFIFSIITKFEILRGMKAKGATTQLRFFNLLCQQNKIINLNDDIIATASDIYADLYKRGQMIGDADILIAATALQQGIAIVTNNESHFARISGLQVLNWNR